MVDEQGPRAQRREATLGEILAHAVDIIGEQGAGGLSLGEVARRLGVRTPSLYTYVASKGALYDELFRRGWEGCGEAVGEELARLGPPSADSDARKRAVAVATAFASWCVDHPALAQLMITRPVPGWEPTPAALAPSVALFGAIGVELAALRERGALAATTDVEALGQNLASAVTGVVVRQIANEPGVPLVEGAAGRHLGALIGALVAVHRPEGV